MSRSWNRSVWLGQKFRNYLFTKVKVNQRKSRLTKDDWVYVAT